jgi:hypothetical protein
MLVSVLPSAQIRELYRLIGSNSLTMLWNGRLLLDSNTFESYSMHSKDSIVALSSEPSSYDTRRWLAVTKEWELLNDRISCIVNPSVSREAGRLRDLQLMRLDTRPRSVRKFMSLTAQAASAFSGKSSSGETMCVSDPPSTPNTDPLPYQFAPLAKEE